MAYLLSKYQFPSGLGLSPALHGYWVWSQHNGQQHWAQAAPLIAILMSIPDLCRPDDCNVHIFSSGLGNYNKWHCRECFTVALVSQNLSLSGSVVEALFN